MGFIMKKKNLTSTVNFLKKHNSDRNIKFNSEGERIKTKNDNAHSHNQTANRFTQMNIIGPIGNDKDPLSINRQRSSTNTAIKDTKLRKAVINSVITKLLFSEITQGDALIQLRIQVLGLNQEKYSKLVNVSRKKISDIENNRSNPSVDVLNKVFKPFGLNVGLIPSSPTVLQSILDNDCAEYLSE